MLHVCFLSSLCRGLVYSVWLLYFLMVLTDFLHAIQQKFSHDYYFPLVNHGN